MVKNIHNLIKYIYITDPSSSVKSKQDKHKTTCRLTVVKLMKTKVKDKKLKAEGKRGHIQGYKNVNDGLFIIKIMVIIRKKWTFKC